jgi:hypothetical protein
MTANTKDTGALDTEITTCAVHPDRETGLRCIRCERYMCIDCAVQSPVGYICKECSRRHEDKFFDALTRDYVVTLLITFVLGAAAAFLMAQVRAGLFMIIIGVIAGAALAGLAINLNRRLNNKRRGRWTAHAAVAGALLGCAVGGLPFVNFRAIIGEAGLFALVLFYVLNLYWRLKA